MKPTRRLDTRLIHEGEPHPRIERAVCLPIFQSATFEFGGEDSYHDLRYSRLNNTPNHTALHRVLASLEGAEEGVVTASGMAAIGTALFAFLGSGDHLLVQKAMYGGTHDLVTKDFVPLGIAHDFIDPTDPSGWKEKLRPETRVIYIESISNPLMDVPDFEAAVAFAREHGLVSIIDNTFLSPVNFRPIEHGIDVVLHSATKYLNGHSDIIAGAILGSRVHLQTITKKLNHMGGTLDPHACFLLHRGLKTLALRVRHQNASAQRIASFLHEHPSVKAVHYPGLPSHPQHERAKHYFDGFSGMLSFELHGDARAADQWASQLELAVSAPSLGGVETLVTRPATTSHLGLSPEERAAAGISDSLIRISVGIEHPDDLIEDMRRALESH